MAKKVVFPESFPKRQPNAYMSYTLIYKQLLSLLARIHGLLKGLGGGLSGPVERLVWYNDVLELVLGDGIDGVCVWEGVSPCASKRGGAGYICQSPVSRWRSP